MRLPPVSSSGTLGSTPLPSPVTACGQWVNIAGYARSVIFKNDLKRKYIGKSVQEQGFRAGKKKKEKKVLHISLSPLFLRGKNMGHCLCPEMPPRSIKKITIIPVVHSQTNLYLPQLSRSIPPPTRIDSVPVHPSEYSIHRNIFSVDKVMGL